MVCLQLMYAIAPWAANDVLANVYKEHGTAERQRHESLAALNCKKSSAVWRYMLQAKQSLFLLIDQHAPDRT